MKAMRASLPLVALLACVAAAPSPAPRFPTARVIDLGTTQLIAESDGDAALGGVQIFVAAGLDREPAGANGISALVAESILRTPVTLSKSTVAQPLKDAIAAKGGSLTYTVDGRTVHYYLEGRAQNMAALVTLLGKALAMPDFSTASLAAGRASLSNRIDDLESNALSVGVQMFRRSYYATGAGDPALGNTATLAALSSRDVAAFYRATYRRTAISASAAGDVTSTLDGALKSLIAGLPDGAVAAVPESAKPIPAQAPRIVAHRDVSAPWVVLGFAAPSPNSRDFGAMLVLESLLSGGFEHDSATTLGFLEKSVGAFYLYDATPASLVVYVNGTQVDPSQALRQLLIVSKSLSLKPLGAEPLRHFKAAAEGQFLADSVNLSDRSYLLGAFAAQGLGPDAINAALASLEATSAADVQRVAKAYLQRYIVALVLPRQDGAQ